MAKKPMYLGHVNLYVRNAERSNLGTLIGAVCFFVGAFLLLPERTEEVSDPVTHQG